MRAFLAVALLVAGCASQGVSGDEDFYGCDERRDLSFGVALNSPRVKMDESVDELTMVIDIDNNGATEVEVMAIRLEPGTKEHDRYGVTPSYRKFNRVIAAGSSEVFELPVSGARLADTQRRGSSWSDTFEVIVSVYLEGGAAYRCEFSIPAPRV